MYTHLFDDKEDQPVTDDQLKELLSAVHNPLTLVENLTLTIDEDTSVGGRVSYKWVGRIRFVSLREDGSPSTFTNVGVDCIKHADTSLEYWRKGTNYKKRFIIAATKAVCNRRIDEIIERIEALADEMERENV